MEIQTLSEEEKEEIIRYGLDEIKKSCMMRAVTLLMGYVFHVFLQSIVFLICFIALRKYVNSNSIFRTQLDKKNGILSM